MKYLIDIGHYEDPEYVIINDERNILDFLKVNSFDVVAYGTEFNVQDGVTEITMKDLSERRRPLEQNEVPTPETLEADFKKMQEWKQIVSENRISGGGWDDCKSAEEHYTHLMDSYKNRMKQIEEWKSNWKEYI